MGVVGVAVTGCTGTDTLVRVRCLVLETREKGNSRARGKRINIGNRGVVPYPTQHTTTHFLQSKFTVEYEAVRPTVFFDPVTLDVLYKILHSLETLQEMKGRTNIEG